MFLAAQGTPPVGSARFLPSCVLVADPVHMRRLRAGTTDIARQETITNHRSSPLV